MKYLKLFELFNVDFDGNIIDDSKDEIGLPNSIAELEFDSNELCNRAVSFIKKDFDDEKYNVYKVGSKNKMPIVISSPDNFYQLKMEGDPQYISFYIKSLENKGFKFNIIFSTI